MLQTSPPIEDIYDACISIEAIAKMTIRIECIRNANNLNAYSFKTDILIDYTYDTNSFNANSLNENILDANIRIETRLSGSTCLRCQCYEYTL